MTATKMMDAIEEAIAGLADMPQKCPPVKDERLASTGYRKLVVKNYTFQVRSGAGILPGCLSPGFFTVRLNTRAGWNTPVLR